MSRIAVRELKRGERRRIREFAHRNCSNYDAEYRECPLLDGCCYMDTIAYTDSGLCSYFRDAVLPLDRELESLLLKSNFNQRKGQIGTRECPVCGVDFPATGRRVYCSNKCYRDADRKAAMARMRETRKNKG